MSKAREASRGATLSGAAGGAGSMIGLLIVTHGDMGKGLLQAAKLIVGSLNGVATLSLEEGESLEELRHRLANAIGGLDSGSGVLVLLDLYGGTPANAAALALDQDRVEAVAGVNLPMLVEALQHREAIPLPKLAARIADAGKRGIQDLRANQREQASEEGEVKRG